MKRQRLIDRREMLRYSAAGLGLAGAAGVCGLTATAAAASNPLAARPPHFQPKAKRVIMFYLTGGCSHVDSFDPKPELTRRAEKDDKLLGSPWATRMHGQSGIATTDLFPEVSRCIDDICLIRSMHGDHNNHTGATLGMHTGSVSVARPSIGAWVGYGLGTQNPNLPGYVVLASEPPYTGSLAWDSNFLPAHFQGVRIVPGEEPIENLRSRDSLTQPFELDLLETLNRGHASRAGGDPQLRSRQAAFRTALGLQQTAPRVFDTGRESDSTLKLYGIDREDRHSFGWQCLVARRMAEAGVRFIELVDIGSENNWDKAHGDIRSHEPLARAIDLPIAALLKDLKQRGMLEETLVMWCTEFGRTPKPQNQVGRSHHSRAFTCWLAGGGVRGGHVHGATDEIGNSIVENPCHTHDFHATILHLLGLDHQRLTYRHNGRDFRLTDVAGNVVHEIIA